MTYIIVAGGTVEDESFRGFIDELDESSLFIVACDSGYDTCIRLNIRPELVIGDFDSAREGTYEKVLASKIPVIKLDSIKDDTDTEAALKWIFNNSNPDDEIYIWGGTGTRIDHVMGNISLIGMGTLAGRKIIMLDGHNRINMIRPDEVFLVTGHGQYGKYISVFPYMGKVRGLTMEGFKYPLTDAELKGFDTLTVSNELIAEKGVISIKEGYLLVMETRD